MLNWVWVHHSFERPTQGLHFQSRAETSEGKNENLIRNLNWNTLSVINEEVRRGKSKLFSDARGWRGGIGGRRLIWGGNCFCYQSQVSPSQPTHLPCYSRLRFNYLVASPGNRISPKKNFNNKKHSRKLKINIKAFRKEDSVFVSSSYLLANQ